MSKHTLIRVLDRTRRVYGRCLARCRMAPTAVRSFGRLPPIVSMIRGEQVLGLLCELFDLVARL
jgi:hypothetical protein